MFLVSWHVLSRVLYRCAVSFLFLSSLLLGLLWRWCFFSFGIFTFKPGRELWLLWLLCLQRGSNHGSNSSSNPGSRQCWLHMQHVMHLSSVARCEGSMAKGTDAIGSCDILLSSFHAWILRLYLLLTCFGRRTRAPHESWIWSWHRTWLQPLHESMSLPPRPLNVSQKPAASGQSAPMGGVSAHNAGLPSGGRRLWFDSGSMLDCRFSCADETSVHLTPEAPAIEHDKSMTVFSSARTRAFGAASIGLGWQNLTETFGYTKAHSILSEVVGDISFCLDCATRICIICIALFDLVWLTLTLAFSSEVQRWRFTMIRTVVFNGFRCRMGHTGHAKRSSVSCWVLL